MGDEVITDDEARAALVDVARPPLFPEWGPVQTSGDYWRSLTERQRLELLFMAWVADKGWCDEKAR